MGLEIIKRFAGYFHKYRVYAILAAVCIAAETVLELAIPLVMSDLVDVGVANGDRAYIFQQGGLMVGCAVLAMIFGVGSARFAAVCGHGLAAEIRKAEYQKIQSFSFANRDRFRTESLVTRMTSDVITIQNAVVNGMRPAVRAPMMMLTALVMSFVINARLALVFVVATPTLGFLVFQIVRHVRPLYAKLQGAIDQVNRIIQENLTAIRIVKAYVRGDYESAKFDQVNQNLRGVAEHSFRLAVLNMPALQLVMYCTILAILWIGGGMIVSGDLMLGKLTGFLSYVLQVLNSMILLSNVFLLLTRAMASGQRILEVMDEPIDITEERARDVRVEHGSVKFDHVSFKYRSDAAEYVLRDINLEIRAGETVGIIGGTGSAKSTLVQLIPRLYEVTEGTLLVDGRPVYEYPLAHLRDAIAMVLQKNTLFSGLGQGGVNVSGGQKQRLCIARAILKKPKVLIMDDSTSAVDMVTEAKIRDGLARCLPDTTKIIIAQRITSVLHADKIVILDDGKIDAVGDHWHLLDTNKIYQEIYHSQQEGAGL